jgi:hypothetical protein
MHRQLRSHLTFANVTSLIALFVALGGTTYAATGGNFILGQPNSAGTPTQLSSPTTTAAGALKVANTNTTTAGRGITAQGGAGGFGLWASGGNVSKNTAAVHGQSGAGNAVEGFSTANPGSGVYGQNNNASSYGVVGHSNNGVAVVGDSLSGWAMQALGNATQSRTGNGFVKAMALVDPVGHPSDPIQQCFTSQLAASQATSGNCGITYSSSSAGQYSLDFGFRVDDRFASVTPKAVRVIASATFTASPSNVLMVTTYDQIANANADLPFYIIVY